MLRKLFACFLCCYFFNINFAQNTIYSAYSYYGIGELNLDGFAENIAKGRTGLASGNKYNFSLLNPASMGWLKYTVFKGGVLSNTVFLKNNDSSNVRNATMLNYIAFAFPVLKWWKTGAELSPYTGVGYLFSENLTFSGIGDAKSSYSGNGGISRINITNAFKINNFLSFGFNTSYLFGSISKQNTLEFLNSTNTFNSFFNDNLFITSFIFDAGMEIKHNFTNESNISFAYFLSPYQKIKGKRDIEAYNYIKSANESFIKDTIYRFNDSIQYYTLPLQYSFGLTYINYKWQISADYKFLNWQKSSYYSSDSLISTKQIALGAGFTPDRNASKGFWKRNTYYFGIHYLAQSSKINEVKYSQYGISTGITIRIPKAMSDLNIGIELARRGNIKTNNVEENFFRFNFGFTLNDKWFIKRKYE